MNHLVTIDNLLSATECRRMITHLESVGFHEQFSGDRRMIRARCVQADQEFAEYLWPKMEPFVGALASWYNGPLEPEPATETSLDAYHAVGLNELLRCYKYRPGEQFQRHQDFAHEWDITKRTFLTVLIYLNDDFTGGGTWFESETVKAVPGRAAVFPHELVHAGNPVTDGIKYALRSDVVFSVPRKAEDRPMS